MFSTNGHSRKGRACSPLRAARAPASPATARNGVRVLPSQWRFLMSKQFRVST